MNEKEERHQNLHLQNLFIPESRKCYSACNVIVLCPIVNGCLCFHGHAVFFFRYSSLQPPISRILLLVNKQNLFIPIIAQLSPR